MIAALGVLLIATGVLLIRQGVVGRAENIGEDLRDFVDGVGSGDLSNATEVLERRAEPLQDPGSLAGGGPDAASAADDAGTRTAAAGTLLKEMARLAETVNYRYAWGASGGQGFDCSGLVWRAMKNIGMYDGPRFTTLTFSAVARSQGWPEVQSPQAGDVVNWAGQHMGVYMSNGTMYAAKSSRSGIGTQKVVDARRSAPRFYRPATGAPSLNGRVSAR